MTLVDRINQQGGTLWRASARSRRRMTSCAVRKRAAKVLLDLADCILEQRLGESEAAIASRSDALLVFIKKARELKTNGA